MPHKNWPEICEIGKRNVRLMMAIATIDMKDPLAARLVGAFPECFSEVEVRGPIPLSILREYARQSGFKEDGNLNGEDHLVFYYATHHYSIPVIEFACTDDQGGRDVLTKMETPPIPNTEWMALYTGDLLAYEGAQYIVVDKDDEFFCVAPAECIDVTL